MCGFIDILLMRFFTTDNLITSELPTVIKEILTLDNCCRVPMIRTSVFDNEFVVFHPILHGNYSILLARQLVRPEGEI